MNYYEPKYLAGVIEKTLPLRLFFRTRYFSETLTFPTETITIERTSNNRKLAPYVNRSIGNRAVTRSGYSVTTYHTPYVAPSRVITPDTLSMKLPGENEYSGKSPDDRAAELAAKDLMELQNQIYRLEEYMCARIKQDGILEITGEGVNEVVDYEFTQIEETVSSDKWTDTYDIVSKLREKAGILRKAGVNPDVVIMGEDAANAFLENKKIQKILDLRNVDAGKIAPSELEDGISYIGRIAVPGLISDIYTYSEYYEAANGQTLPVIDAGTVIMQSSREANSMMFGAVTYIDDDDEYASALAEYVPYTVTDREHGIRKLIVASRPLPLPHDLQSWYTLKNVI